MNDYDATKQTKQIRLALLVAARLYYFYCGAMENKYIWDLETCFFKTLWIKIQKIYF